MEITSEDLIVLFDAIEGKLADLANDLDNFYLVAPVLIKLKPTITEAKLYHQKRAFDLKNAELAEQEAKEKTKLVADLVLDGVKQAAIKSELGMGDFYNDTLTKDKVDAAVRRHRKNPENNTVLLNTIEESVSDSVGNSLINAEDDPE